MIISLSWIASFATIVAAMMTAANWGTRVTGWGFVVFTIGSVSWALVGMLGGQTSLAVTNLFLLLVNIVGVWRWLGRQARHEKGSAVAAEASRRRRAVPTLFSSASLIGADVRDKTGELVGTLVDAMIDSETKQFAYIVIGQGGVAGAGESLRALAPDHFQITGNEVRCDLSWEQVAALEPIDNEAWPVVLREPDRAPARAKGMCRGQTLPA